ncbi:hypothetical protein Hypma_000870 [Hypsizygus marmoreus]|uniref:histone acetyltransferase n=1 Tax=Hypsizygus marmoreus TaxID=39966 RepID=A0A369JA01_HYPMA|nr:hypothetical protein Hypma_000870 [Hypsizygus marmoreus]
MSINLNLRDTLLEALARLPGTREFHLHVLVSSPRKNSSLFPFATPRPRVYLQDILILLSEQATPDSPRIFVTAIEACVYNIPSTSGAILYVSKVDSTGQATSPSPTHTVVRTLFTYYADPATRPIAAENLWIYLFARAQPQYLFPNSAEFAGKHPLSDIQLCAWWRRVFTDVAGELEARVQSKPKIKLYYILPGYSEFEAAHALKNASSSALPVSPSWTYGHPYSQSEITLPCPPDGSEGKKNLGHFIPSFDDDPKSRFMDEIAYTTDGEIKSPSRKRTRTLSRGESSHSREKEKVEDKDGQNGKDERPLGELSKVSADEFWERMSFRQECIAGAVTGFFTLGISCPSLAVAAPPLAPQPGQVSSQINKRIMTSLTTSVEFSTVERSIRGTEIVESAIKGLCEGIASVPTVLTYPSREHREFDRRTPERETSSHSLLAPPSTPPPRLVHGKRVIPDASPNPFPEPVASLETYLSHIYGSVHVSNPALVKKDAQSTVTRTEGAGQAGVTVLTARKRKKRTE